MRWGKSLYHLHATRRSALINPQNQLKVILFNARHVLPFLYNYCCTRKTGKMISSQPPPNDDDQHDEMSAGANYTLFGAACWESTIEARTITSSNDRKYFQKEKLPDFN